MTIKRIIPFLTVIFCLAIQAQQTPGAIQSEVISIVGATAHIGNGEVIKNSTLVFENGKIKAIGTSSSVSPEGRIIKAEGKELYPGFILPNSTLGLGEIDAVRATRDFDELGEILPHIRSLIAYNAESKIVETCRINGVLVAQVTPRGGRISGTSSIVQLDAWNWEDAVVKTDDAVHLNWPSSFTKKYQGFGRSTYNEINKNYEKEVLTVKNHLSQAKSYNQVDNQSRNLPLAASNRIFSEEAKLFIHANLKMEILDALLMTKELGIKNVVIVGGLEAHKVIEELKSQNIPVVLQRVHRLPETEDEAYDNPFQLAAKLTQAGIKVSLENSGDMERMNSRNLPFYAGTLTGYGLNAEEALKLITLNAAEILGIDKQYGSLEIGKSATFFLSEGDALDMRSNQLTHAFIDGRALSLESHQTKLYKRYSKKLNQ